MADQHTIEMILSGIADAALTDSQLAYIAAQVLGMTSCDEDTALMFADKLYRVDGQMYEYVHDMMCDK